MPLRCQLRHRLAIIYLSGRSGLWPRQHSRRGGVPPAVLTPLHSHVAPINVIIETNAFLQRPFWSDSVEKLFVHRRWKNSRRYKTRRALQARGMHERVDVAM